MKLKMLTLAVLLFTISMNKVQAATLTLTNKTGIPVNVKVEGESCAEGNSQTFSLGIGQSNTIFCTTQAQNIYPGFKNISVQGKVSMTIGSVTTVLEQASGSIGINCLGGMNCSFALVKNGNLIQFQ